MPEPLLRIENAVKRFSSPSSGRLTVFDGLNLSFASGEFVCLLGPSGCGKSTLLNAIAGQEPLNSGTICFAGASAKPVRIAMVWQSDSLMPWKTAQGNVEFSLSASGVPSNEHQPRAVRWLEAVGLAGFEKYYPAQLSAGMRQRVSLQTSRNLIFPAA